MDASATEDGTLLLAATAGPAPTSMAAPDMSSTIRPVLTLRYNVFLPCDIARRGEGNNR